MAVDEPRGAPANAGPTADAGTKTIEIQETGTAERDLYVDYRTEMQSAEGIKPLPDPLGLSGSGLWKVNPRSDGVWSPDHAQLVAVVISRNYEDDPQSYLRGTLIREWLQLLRDDIPELSSAIDPALRQGLA